MEKFFNFFVLVQPYLPMPRLMVVPLQAVFGVIFLLWLLVRVLSPRPRRIYPIQTMFFVLFAWICLADLFNLARIHSFQEFRHVAGRLVFLITIIATYHVVRDRQSYRRVLGFLMGSISVLAAFTIFCAVFNFDPFGVMPKNPRTFWGTSMIFRRTTGLDMSYGAYGLLINSVLPLFMVSFWQKDFMLRRSWAIMGIFLLLFALFVTQSRNSWLATFLVMIFSLAVLAFRSPDLFVKVMMVLGLALGAIITTVWLIDYLYYIFKGFALERYASTFYRRLEVDRLAVGLFLKHPLFGVGHEAVTEEIQRKLGWELVIHNGYLDQLASTGVFGFIPYLALLALSFLGLMQIARKGAPYWRPYALCLAASLVANMTVLMAYKGFFSATFAIEYGLMLSLVELNKTEQQNEVVHATATADLPSDYHLVQTGWQ